MCAYQGIGNVGFSENFAYVLNDPFVLLRYLASRYPGLLYRIKEIFMIVKHLAVKMVGTLS